MLGPRCCACSRISTKLLVYTNLNLWRLPLKKPGEERPCRTYRFRSQQNMLNVIGQLSKYTSAERPVTKTSTVLTF